MPSFDLVSDLHLDAYPNWSEAFIKAWEPTSPILVIAGDTSNGLTHEPDQIRALQDIKSKYEHVVMILGNHDYYGLSFPVVGDAFKLLGSLPGFTCLENQVQEVGGITFAGTTLWFEYLSEHSGISRWFPDFYQIKHFAYVVNNKHQDAKDFLAGLNNVDVVITHHLPSYKSVHPKYETADNNAFYVASVDEHIQRIKPKVWAHGHTHEYADYKLFDTRVVCNPRGYPNEHPEPYQVKRIEVE